MVRKRKLATVLAYLTLEMGALLGVPVRLDQIHEMNRLLNGTIAIRLERRDGGGEPPTDGEDETQAPSKGRRSGR